MRNMFLDMLLAQSVHEDRILSLGFTSFYVVAEITCITTHKGLSTDLMGNKSVKCPSNNRFMASSYDDEQFMPNNM